MIDVTENKRVAHSYEFKLYFDATDCIPNMGGDGCPNLKSDDRYYITPDCIKHKIRVWLLRNGRRVLHINDDDQKCVMETLLAGEQIDSVTDDELLERELRYSDIRMFGTMDLASTQNKKKKKKKNSNKDSDDVDKNRSIIIKIEGPISIALVKSMHPVEINYRKRGSKSYVICNEDVEMSEGNGYGTDAWFVEYGLFELRGGVDIYSAQKTGLLEQDIDDFFEALWHMFDNDASTLRPKGSMRPRKLIVWEYNVEAPNDNPHMLGDIYDFHYYKLDGNVIQPNGIDNYMTNSINEIDHVKIYER